MPDFVCGVYVAWHLIVHGLAVCEWSSKNGRQYEVWGREEMSTRIALCLAWEQMKKSGQTDAFDFVCGACAARSWVARWWLYANKAAETRATMKGKEEKK